MVYLKNYTLGCYKMKINTPKRFKEDKKSKKYKEWKKKKDKEYDDKVTEFISEKWWNIKNKLQKKYYLKIYKTKKVAKQRMIRFNCNIGNCKSYEILNL